MGTIDYFNEFYSSLSTLEHILFWLVIFIFLFLIGFSINLYLKNRELKFLLLSKKEKEQKAIVEEMRLREELRRAKEVKREEEVIKEVKKEEVKTGPYSKNVLRDISTRHQTSPISIGNDKKIEKTKKEVDNVSYAEEITKKLEEELKPQTIELTDYERQQEEEAIISYKELVSSSRDKVYNITDDEETTDFINELKSFRNSL